MTTPAERTSAVSRLEQAAGAIIAHTVGRRGLRVLVDRELIEDLHRALRHYPSREHLELSAQRLPDIWGK